MYMITCFQCAFQVTWMFQKVIHFTDWVVGHAHMIMFGTFTFWLLGVIDWLWPRIVRRNWYSDALRGWGFWMSLLGVVVMFLDLTMAGLIAGSMQKNLNPWHDIVSASEPFWWVRTFSGGLMIVGLFCVLYNMWMTARSDVAYVEDEHLVPLAAD
jgi:cytochrome c oxidase cbb3-type subunit I